MAYWQMAPFQREQIVLFAPTLEARIPEDHPVRLLDEILATVDWSEWENQYHGRRGQPPIHPRFMASAILYGMTRRIRSSRQLEYGIHHSIDLMWLVEGRSIDHSTICEFRTKFKDQIRSLFQHVCKMAARMGLVRLLDACVDGTRVLADSNRAKTYTAEKLKKLLAELDRQMEQGLEAAELADSLDELFETDESSPKLPSELAELQQRQARLKELLEQAEAMDKARRREGINPEKNPAQIPITDPDSRVLPNKEGGYAPNYTPMVATDAHAGFIVSIDVISSVVEHSVLCSMIDDIEETFGERPQAALGDGVYATGENLKGLDERGVELFSPLQMTAIDPENPAVRDDPTKPVAEEDRERLPINPQSKRLDKGAFVYKEDEDRYYCPEGRALDYEETKTETRRGQTISRRVYRSPDCSGCPLIDLCQQANATNGRTVSRDVHDERRQEHAEKMATEAAKERYKKRFHTAEAPFGHIKRVLEFRRFLLRGLEKVKTEFTWCCTAFNLAKLIRHTARLRAEFAALAQADIE